MPRKSKRLNKCEITGKCGEIFHHNQSFTIICTSCDEKCFNFQEFTDHFQENHTVKNENISFNEATEILVTELSPADLGLEFSDSDEVEPLEINTKVDINQLENLNPHDENNLNIVPRQHKNCYTKLDSEENTNIERTSSDEESISKSNRNDLRKGCLCTICGKYYKTRRTLREHMAIHNNSKSFVCDFEGCEKAFISNRRLITHKRIHTGKRNFVCEICGYRTFKNAVLTAHVRTHTGEKPFPCKICGKHFISMSSVKEHAATHTTERRFRCDICNATFTRPKALYHHKPLHLAVRKFACTICDKTYAQAAGLSAHMRKHKIGGKILLGIK